LVVQKTEADLAVAVANLDSARQGHQFAVSKAQQEVAVAQSTYDNLLNANPAMALEEAKILAEKQQQQSILKALRPGQVLKIFTRAGDVVGNQPIMQIADLEKMVCVAEVHVAQIAAIRSAVEAKNGGSIAATIRSEAWERELHGKLFESGLQKLVGSAQNTSLDPFAPNDRYIAEVRIEIDQPDVPLTRQFVRLPVEVELHVAPRLPSTEGDSQQPAVSASADTATIGSRP
jgi:HlyD family secretion protein